MTQTHSALDRPSHPLSSPQAFSAAAPMLLLDAQANAQLLVFGALLLMHEAFSRMPPRTQAIFEVNVQPYSMESLELRAPPDSLARGEAGYVYFHKKQDPSGWTPSVDFDQLSGPGFDMDDPTWLHPALEEAIDATATIRRALDIIAEANPSPDRSPSVLAFNFRADSTSVQMFADLFGFQDHIAKAEASILARCANTTTSARRTAAL